MTLHQFEKALPKYIAACSFQTPASIANKQRTCRYFIEFIRGNTEAGTDPEITPESVLDFRNALACSPSTINKHLENLHAVFAWMQDMEILQGANPVRKAMKIKANQKIHKDILSSEEMLRIARTDYGDNPTEIRRRAIVLLLATSGLRASEVAAVRPCDLDWQAGSIYVPHGKGDKDRVVLFHKIAQEAVQQYLRYRPKEAADTDPLFVGHERATKQMHGLSRITIYNDVKEYVSRLTGNQDVHPHSLRHTFASYLLSNSVPMAEIQSMLGHSSTRTTEIYAKLIAPDVTPIRSATSVFDKVYPHGAPR